MSEEKKKVNLLPICAAFNHLQLFEDGSVAVNPAHIAYWIAEPDGSVVVHMVDGRAFTMNPDQADELVGATRRALEQAHRQAERANSRIAIPSIAH